MKLQELGSTQLENSQKILESHFNHAVDFSTLSHKKAKSMLDRVSATLREHRSTNKVHSSETNPAYLKLMVMEQALAARVKEASSVGTTGTVPPTGTGTDEIDADDEKLAMKKMASGQALTTQDKEAVGDTTAKVAKLMNDPKTSGRLEQMLRQATNEARQNTRKSLMEADVQQAQVVLAAQDVVDKIQDMLEDVTEMQFKEVPALADSIRNEIGTSEAQQYSNDVVDALKGLVDLLQTTKTAVESAQGVLTGQEPVVPGEGDDDLDLGSDMGDDDLDLDLDSDDDMDLDLDGGDEDFGIDAGEELGRERR